MSYQLIKRSDYTVMNNLKIFCPITWLFFKKLELMGLICETDH